MTQTRPSRLMVGSDRHDYLGHVGLRLNNTFLISRINFSSVGQHVFEL